MATRMLGQERCEELRDQLPHAQVSRAHEHAARLQVGEERRELRRLEVPVEPRPTHYRQHEGLAKMNVRTALERRQERGGRARQPSQVVAHDRAPPRCQPPDGEAEEVPNGEGETEAHGRAVRASRRTESQCEPGASEGRERGEAEEMEAGSSGDHPAS